MIKLIITQIDGVLTSEQEKLGKSFYSDGWRFEEFDSDALKRFNKLLAIEPNLCWIIAPSWRSSFGLKLVKKYFGNIGLGTRTLLDVIPKKLGTSLEEDLQNYLDAINPSWKYSHLLYLGGSEIDSFDHLKPFTFKVKPSSGLTEEDFEKIKTYLEISYKEATKYGKKPLLETRWVDYVAPAPPGNFFIPEYDPDDER